MKEKIALITGATSGIGKSTAFKIASYGTHLVLIVRDLSKGQIVKSEILKGYPEAKVDLVEGDLASLFSLKKAIEKIKLQYPVIDLLINNAGGVFEKKIMTVDDLEMGFQVNHLAHFYLTYELLPNILKSSDARVINLSSEAHRMGKIDFENLNTEKKFNTWLQYGATKLMNLLFTKALANKYAAQGLVSFAVHPGVVRTGFGANNSGWLKYFNKMPFIITPDEGSKTTVYCATQTRDKLSNGDYYKKSKKSSSSGNSQSIEVRDKLWDVSVQILQEKGFL